MEVGRDTGLQVLSFAYIDNGSVSIIELVTAWLLWHRLYNVLQLV